SDEEEDNISYRSDEDELLDDSPSDLEEEALGNDSDYVEELPDDDDDGGGGGGDDGSYCTESSFRSHSTLGSTPGRRKSRAARPWSPLLEAKDIPNLELPKSSEDLVIPTSHLLNASAVYEVLRNFGSVLRLSPFRFEDFCAALASQEQCTLLAETHISLLKAILREEDTSNTTFGPADVKDSVNSTLYFVDGMTWPEVLRAYCESDPEYRHILPFQEGEEYPYEPLGSKIKVLQFLVDQFLATNIAREELMSEGVVAYDDHCRVCHRLGDLLCCETCSAVYHLECVKPPLQEVPEDEWQCEVCVAHKVPGVADCIPEVQKTRPFLRQLPLGYDRHRRKYWFLNRRIVVEEDGEQGDKTIWYYSTKVQLAELIDCLDKEYWEADLYAALEEIRDEVHVHMDISEDLTNKARGNNKSFLAAANDEILERFRASKDEGTEEIKNDVKTGDLRPDLYENMVVTAQEGDGDSSLTDGPMLQTASAPAQSVPTATSCSLATQAPRPLASTVEPLLGGDSHTELSGITKDSPSSEAVSFGGDGNHSLNQPCHTSEENSNSSAGSSVLPRGPEPPDLADKSSRSSLACLDDTGPKPSHYIISSVVKQFPRQKSEIKDSANGEAAGQGGKKSSATRMVTRLRNPESKLSQLKNQQVAAAVHEANKGFKEGKEVLVVNAQGDITRVSTRNGKDVVMKGTISQYFKLGQEGKYRVYVNQYTTNTVALNKHQHREDHDKRRHLSHKFCMTPAGEFKWNGSINGSKVLTISTLRLTIIQLENNVPAPLMHPNWASHRTNWIKAVQMCSKAREFALALAILECAIKPVAMLPVWKDSLGHTRLNRMTSMERKLEDEETLQQATWVKYTFPIKHQVWKQKGEEYRVTGYGGWSWISKTYVPRFDPRLPGNTNANYRKELEGLGKSPLERLTSADLQPCEKVEEEMKEEEAEKEKSEELPAEGSPAKMEVDPTDPVSDESKHRNCRTTCFSIDADEKTFVKEESPEGPARPFNYDVVDVSFGFLTRIPFKKKVKSSKLDSLLERRLKQHTIEEGQRQQLSVSSPQTPTPTASALNTPASTLAPIRPHNIAQTELALEKNVKVEKTSTAETPGSLEVGAQPVPPSLLGPTLKDGCSTCTGDDSPAQQNQPIALQGLKGDLMERTTKLTQSVSESSEQESVNRSNEEETSSEGIHSSMEKETKKEEHNIKVDIVRTGSLVFDQKCSQNTAPPKPSQQNTEGFRSVHSPTEKNGMVPVENNESMQDVKSDITEGDEALKSVSPLPQVNGNDGPGSEGVLCSSVVSSNHGMLANSTQPRTNSFGKVGEPSPGLLLKDSVQQKPLVNGDLTQVNKDGGAKGPNQTSKPVMDQDYQPPLKLSRVDNDVDALKEDAQCSQQPSSTPPFQPEENNATPVCKIIRMAPSPIPSAEESSLSNDFTEVFSQTRMAEPLTTIITQVATTSITTTTTVVSTQTKIVPSKTSEEALAPVVSTSESSAVSTLSTMTKTTVTKICSSGLDSQSEDSQSETVTQDQRLSVMSTTSPGGKVSVSSVTVSQERSSTKGRVRLLRFSRTKKTRSDTALPSYCKFVTKSNRKSIFVLPHDDLKVLGRRGGFRDVPIFSYNAKPSWDIWPYPSPRPTFGLTWRYRLQTAQSLAGVSLMLRLLWACLRWDDMAVKPSAGSGTTRTETSETEITTTEIIKRRDVGPYGIRSEYCIRKIICPLGVPETPKETHTPQRKGLRSSALRPKKQEPAKQTGPVVIETWVPEEELDLWEIRAFSERVEKEKAQAAEQAKKRLEQKVDIAATPTGTTATPAATPKVIVGSISGQGTPPTKVVLSTKMGTPITFQQNKNFQQSFATWVKQGQSTQGVVQQKVLGIIPSSTAGGSQTYTTLQPRTNVLNIRANSPGSQQQVLASGQIRPGMTVIRTPIQQTGAMGKTVIQTPLVVQQGQGGQQVVTQIIRGQAVSTAIPGASPVATVSGQGAASPTAPGTARAQGQGQVKLTLAQLGQLIQVVSNQQTLTVMVQGQGQTSGQLQIIPQGVTVIPGPGQQLMQAALPGGQMQRFLFTPMASAATPTPSTGHILEKQANTSGLLCNSCKIFMYFIESLFVFVCFLFSVSPATTVPGQADSASIKSPALPTQQAVTPVQAGATPLATTAAPASASPQSQLPHQMQAHMPTQSPTSLQVKTQGGTAQLKLQQTPQIISMSGLQQQVQKSLVLWLQVLAQLQTQQGGGSLPQHIKLQLPIQIQQTGTSSTQGGQMGNIVTIQAASVQEQLQRIQQLREQQQQKKKQAAEAKREQALNAASQNDIIQKQVVMKQNAVIEHLKQKKTMTPAEREENQRMIVCNQVMKFLLDRIDKDERQAAKRKKKEEVVEAKRRLANASKLSSLLYRHKESLKMEILKKRALLDKELQLEAQEELKRDLLQMRQEKERAHRLQHAHSNSSQHHYTPASSAHKRKREEEREVATPTKSKKKKMISTTSTKESKKDTKLYCICKTPYDETKFYIGCDRCQNWYHGRCVGILQSEANHIDEYVCPQCQSTEDAMTVFAPLTDKDYEGLRRTLRSLQAHKMAWPFLEPVDTNDAPDYYRVIKEPMDLSTMEERLQRREYVKLTEFVADMTKIFDNCRYYNPSDSPFYQCAEVLENFFVQKLKCFKASSRSHNNKLQSGTS
uniref:Bromodomain PHD finger transcription factor n=1 Tax=Tetraodon nigroviridis TaxID=99883 RepID=H3D9E3_TETNG